MAACTRENITSYFEALEDLYNKNHYLSSMVFNFDETMIENSPKCVRVLVPQECSNVAFPYCPNLLHMTLGLCIAADGTGLQPLLILPNKEFPMSLAALGGFFHWSGAESGWINKEIFFQWTDLVFIPEVKKRRELLMPDCPNRRALLLVDGHSSRACAETMIKLQQCDVDVFCIPSHTSHILQPLDCGVNRHFKTVMKSRRILQIQSGISSRRLALLQAVKKAVHYALFEGTILDSFAACGVWPLDRSVVLDGPRITPPDFEAPVRKKKHSTISISNTVLTSPRMIGLLSGTPQRSEFSGSSHPPETPEILDVDEHDAPFELPSEVTIQSHENVVLDDSPVEVESDQTRSSVIVNGRILRPRTHRRITEMEGFEG